MFGTVWDIVHIDESCRRSVSFTKEDNHRLQVIQNKFLRLKTGLPKDTPTKDLVKASEDLSIQQLTAYTSLVLAQKSIFNQEPAYLAAKFLRNLRRSNKLILPNYRLSLSRDGFFYRSCALFNNLPADLQFDVPPKEFKSKVKLWIRENVPVRPTN